MQSGNLDRLYYGYGSYFELFLDLPYVPHNSLNRTVLRPVANAVYTLLQNLVTISVSIHVILLRISITR